MVWCTRLVCGFVSVDVPLPVTTSARLSAKNVCIHMSALCIFPFVCVFVSGVAVACGTAKH